MDWVVLSFVSRKSMQSVDPISWKVYPRHVFQMIFDGLSLGPFEDTFHLSLQFFAEY